MPPIDIFPTLHCCAKLTNSNDTLFDVKFYPYSTTENDQIFAVVGVRDIFICRPVIDGARSFEVLRWFKDKNPDTDLNCFTWAKYPVTGNPVICAAGAAPKQIKIIDIDKGEPIRVLPGHGKGINDLVVSPLNSSLVASASEDYTIRLWNIDPEYEERPCVAIFSGEGHRQPILAAQFHPNGRWLISGGVDTAVCIWAVPTVEELKNSRDTMLIHYPVFYSTEVHHNYVDGIAFYGNLIFSRAATPPGEIENETILWRIRGFDPDAKPPSRPLVPHTGVHTRSAFANGNKSLFERLITFATPYNDRFYHRFNLLHIPGVTPILCIGTQESRFLFWNLSKLEDGWGIPEEIRNRQSKSTGKKGRGVIKNTLKIIGDAKNGEKVGDKGIAGESGPEDVEDVDFSDESHALGDPFIRLEPHCEVTPQTTLTSRQHFATSQLAWSPDATWLVGVGDRGIVVIFHRDQAI